MSSNLYNIASTVCNLILRRTTVTKLVEHQETKMLRLLRPEVDRICNMRYERLELDRPLSASEGLMLSAISKGDYEALNILAKTPCWHNEYANLLVREYTKQGDSELLNERITARFIKWLDARSDWINRDTLFSDLDLVIADDKIIQEGNTWYCEECDCKHTDDVSANEVVTSMNVCGRVMAYATACDEMSSFYCNESDRHYCASEFNEGNTTSGNTICCEWAETQDEWCCNDDDEWTTSPESDTEIPDYHDADRSIIRRALGEMHSETITVTKLTRRFGVEIEMEFSNSDDRERWYCQNIDGSDCAIAETDGSLDDDNGLEVISTPVMFKDWHHDTPFIKLVRSARANGAKGWDVRGTYGVHINMDMRDLTSEEIHLTYAAVNNMSGMWELLSGRKMPMGGFNKLDVPNSMAVSDVWDAYYQQSRCQRNTKYQPIVIKDYGDRLCFAEVRTFGSNLRGGAVLEYIQLCSAVVEWVKSVSNAPHDGPMAVPVLQVYADQPHHRFLLWLDKQDGYDQLRSQVERFRELLNTLDDSQLAGVKR